MRNSALAFSFHFSGIPTVSCSVSYDMGVSQIYVEDGSVVAVDETPVNFHNSDACPR